MTDTIGGAGDVIMGTRGSGRVRTAVLWQALRRTVDELASTRPGGLEVIDAGGGTGGLAVPLASLGHKVTVVDASPDALAALERRAAEAGVAVASVQGDAGDLLDLIGPGRADLVLCHSVLEYTDDPAAVMAALAGTVRPGGAVSVLVAGRLAAAVHRALTGHFDQARRALTDPAGRWGERDPVPLRFTRQTLTELAEGAGLRVAELQGVRIFADLVPGALLDGEAEAVQSLIELETAASVHPVLRDLATQLHLLARK
ncbi:MULTISPECIES: methyltransferase [Thermomonospora]|jgi:S-adenosylmethionine-dependent methyltransferase|uniref:Methyltransferase type 11 n=1 Tax=Thermomonospora curvata (strain ATCC 19995 / DSM 43183 / JCM 3096 / KCTC 9072 / NBRC 15933 / NCIMB 10081 / Henssen B9) TaxID=471852 RepID=D1A7W1_THECD|nr:MULTISPECIES: methyltransferase [Thermomonospora]ACY98483.1 Methyltransferase type 11 [Thermomonospora curvata DSM 43183]PKK13629.1 MAG: methyltransferase domain-containing protein [Thermomonospora sp. CIF 1]